MTEKPDNHWHLDKRVPLALIFALALQGAGGVWWASTANERLAQVERRLESFATRSEAMQSTINQQGQSIAVLVSRIEDTNRNLDRIGREVSTTNALLRELISRPMDGRGNRGAE